MATVSTLVSTLVLATVTSNAKPLTGILGICNRIGTTRVARIQHDPYVIDALKRLTPQYTKVQWLVDSEDVLVKFKVSRKVLCKHLADVMGEVQTDLKRMLFKGKADNVAKNAKDVAKDAKEVFVH